MLIQGNFGKQKNNSDVVATYEFKLSGSLSYKVSLIEPKDRHRQFDIVLYGSDSDEDYNAVMQHDFYKNFLIPWINNKAEVEAVEHAKEKSTVIDFTAAARRKNKKTDS